MVVRSLLSPSVTLRWRSFGLLNSLPGAGKFFSTTTSTNNTSPTVRVWWDSACPLCMREINFMKRLDQSHHKRIDFVDIRRDTEAVEACPISTQDLIQRFHAQRISTPHEHRDSLNEQQPILSGAAAFALMWTELPAPLRWVGLAAQRSPLILRVAEKSYVWFLKHLRPTLQRWVTRYDRAPR
ncbi:hypothetical protein BJ741DRAFT_587061 [Chytriomyces cf. hyalinus JEL632]|nr:hypothetical protein BJ741DRAFT_587061 [Chytriomyces cf. hyalinus JEL632]